MLRGVVLSTVLFYFHFLCEVYLNFSDSSSYCMILPCR